MDDIEYEGATAVTKKARVEERSAELIQGRGDLNQDTCSRERTPPKSRPWWRQVLYGVENYCPSAKTSLPHRSATLLRSTKQPHPRSSL